MGTVNKEQLQKIKDFFENNPDEARKFLEENPKILEVLNGNILDNQSGNTMGGKQLAKTMPGTKIPRMFDWDDNGFSNYITLAVLAFVIQFAITLICIFFYK